MSDPTATRAALRVTLIARIGDTPVETAIALRRGGDLSTLAELANDRELSARQRSIALLAVALLLAEDPAATIPDDALDTVEDPDVIATAIQLGLSAALTGVLRAAPLGPSLRPTRMLIGRQLVAAGERGPHVIRLLLDANDRDRAAEVAAADLGEHLARTHVNAEIWARLHLVIEWSEDAEFFAAMIRALAPAHPAAPDTLAKLLEKVPGASPSAVAHARAGIGWALTDGKR